MPFPGSTPLSITARTFSPSGKNYSTAPTTFIHPGTPEHLEEPRSGVIGVLHPPSGRVAPIGPYFVTPLLDTSLQYPHFVVPRLAEL